MPSVDLGKLYDGMQQEMEAGLKTGASVLMHPGMKGTTQKIIGESG